MRFGGRTRGQLAPCGLLSKAGDSNTARTASWLSTATEIQQMRCMADPSSSESEPRFMPPSPPTPAALPSFFSPSTHFAHRQTVHVHRSHGKRFLSPPNRPRNPDQMMRRVQGGYLKHFASQNIWGWGSSCSEDRPPSSSFQSLLAVITRKTAESSPKNQKMSAELVVSLPPMQRIPGVYDGHIHIAG
jgi:hypothetical protein